MSPTAARPRRYTFQRPDDLALSLYKGACPADAAWVLEERWVRDGEWQIGAQIVGASHVAVLARGRAALTEVLVAQPVHRAAPVPLQVLSEFEGRRIVVDTGEWLYAQEVGREQWAQEEMDQLARLWRSECPDRLAAAYPVGPGGRPGMTVLAWSASPSRLRLDTLHTYPDEGVAVTTAAICRMRG